MENCPVCGKYTSAAAICDACGFDFSCDYERHRTLCSVLPGWAEPVSVRAAKRKRPQQRTITISPDDLMCPACGGTRLLFQIDELQFMCADCGAKKPIPIQTGAAPAGMGKADGPAHDKDALLAQVLGMLLMPITSLAVVTKAIVEKQGGSVGEAAAK